MLLKLVAGCGLIMTSNLAVAATESTMPVMSTLVSPIVVLAVIGVVAFLVKRLGPGGTPQTRLMRVVSQLPLGAREKISIVELDDQWLVLGVTSQQITLLTQIPRKVGAVAPAQILNFSTLFKSALGKHDAT